MKKYNELLEKLIRLTNTMNRTARSPRDFGPGCRLYPAEIHTVEAIGAHKEINANSLAKVLGITKGAVTQMTDRLLKKELIEKYKLENNKKEVYFRLTETGALADRAHDSFHEQIYATINEYLDTLSKNQIDAIVTFLDIYTLSLPSE